MNFKSTLDSCCLRKAAVNAPHSRRFARKHDSQNARQRLECVCFSTALEEIHQTKSNHCNQIKPLLLGLAFIWLEGGILFSIRAFAPLREVSVPPNGILRKVAEASERLRKEASRGVSIFMFFAHHCASVAHHCQPFYAQKILCGLCGKKQRQTG